MYPPPKRRWPGLLGAYLALLILLAVPSVLIYYYVEPAYKLLVIRVGAGAILAFTLYRMLKAVREHLEQQPSSSFEAAAGLPAAAIFLAPQFEKLQNEVLEQVLLGILANGHILIEDYPGLAKTLIARLCAQVTDLDFKRIQFTPDLLPSDITGSFLYNQREGTFEFRRGPVFTNLLLADEINRATPKTQAALLEVMQEQQVTIEGNALL
jgi:MoxR-like ATPase